MRRGADLSEYAALAEGDESYISATPKELGKLIKQLEKDMYAHAKNLEFEAAAAARDRLKKIRDGSFLSTMEVSK